MYSLLLPSPPSDLTYYAAPGRESAYISAEAVKLVSNDNFSLSTDVLDESQRPGLPFIRPPCWTNIIASGDSTDRQANSRPTEYGPQSKKEYTRPRFRDPGTQEGGF